MPKRITDGRSWSEVVDLTANRIGLANNQDFKNWMMKREAIGYRFDYNLINYSYRIYKRLQSEFDNFTVCSGHEGFGKTTLLIQLCSWVDPTFDINRVCFSTQEFIEQLKNAKKGQAILMDEGGINLFSRESMSSRNVMLMKLFMIIRARCIFVAIAIPSFFVLDSYVRNHRIDCLLNITQRGLYTGYLGNAIKKISVDGNKYKNLSGIKIPEGTFWKGNFRKEYPLNVSFKDYETKKEEHISGFLDKTVEELPDVKLIALSKVVKESGISRQILMRRIKLGELPAKKISALWYVSKQAYLELISTKKALNTANNGA